MKRVVLIIDLLQSLLSTFVTLELEHINELLRLNTAIDTS